MIGCHLKKVETALPNLFRIFMLKWSANKKCPATSSSSSRRWCSIQYYSVQQRVMAYLLIISYIKLNSRDSRPPPLFCPKSLRRAPRPC